MVKLEEAVIARLETHGEKFEVLVDPDLAMDLKKGRQPNLNEMLALDKIFKDARKGEEASENKLKEVFGTTEIGPIVKKIILQGNVQLTTDQRKRMKEERHREIVQLIARNALNPQTNSPHPPQRIENALAEAKINVDPARTAEDQMQEILKEIRKLIPISFEKMQVAVKVPATFAGKVSAFLHNHDLKKEEWRNDGSLIALLEIPAGMKAELFSELNHLTHGEIETKILEKR
ncbi:MAG: ribosome assembly factor SBDS [Candidatus Diapherotrites archaeon]|nr:ribosome assembly factor SBDS [Candidatus Diapherotrites archaeon]